jgi:hypothetical protein
MHLRRTSTTQRANSSRTDGERHSRRDTENQDDSGVPDPSRERESGSEIAEFVALCKTLASVNHLLLSYVDEVVASIRAPGAQPLIDEIANQAESIRRRMSLLERLAAELNDTSE